MADLDRGSVSERLGELAGLVERRGACAHPDGTARLVRSLLAAFPEEVEAHGAGRCTMRATDSRRRLRSVS